MQIKNIILSLAAAMALVHAAPAGTDAAATPECSKSLYDTCFEETSKLIKVQSIPLEYAYGSVGAACGYCMGSTIAKCAPEYATRAFAGVDDAKTKKCYKDGMEECKKSNEFAWQAGLINFTPSPPTA